VEVALVLPLFIAVILFIITLGIAAFYQQQLGNAARQGARYASIHSATSQCPTVSNLSPDVSLLPAPNQYYACDPPSTHWPLMLAAVRDKLFGLDKARVRATACWSGYWTKDTNGAWKAWDQIAVNPSTGQSNEFRQCTVPVFGWTASQNPDLDASAQHTINPRTGLDVTPGPNFGMTIQIDCSRDFPLTRSTDDMASAYAASNAGNSNQASVIACYEWSPPLAGFLLIPRKIEMKATISEELEYQQ
jgi:hypothetical protein